MLESEALPRAERPPLRLRDCYAFFGPLVLMVELNMISKSVIHAFLARTDNPSTSLAAFNAAFTFYFALASATEVMTVLSLSYLKSRADLMRLMAFTGLLLLVPISIAIAVTFTPFGNLVFGSWFGLGPQAQGEARLAVGILALTAPVLMLRGAAFAQLMMVRQTIIITWSTLLRLLSLTVSLAILPLGLQGATIGAGALVLCMAAESLFAWGFAWRHLKMLPAVRGAKESLFTYWKFAWPLMINHSAELGSIFVINLYLGRLDKSEIAIAAFGVVHGLISLLMAPLRTLAQSAQTLVARRQDVRTMFLFAGQLVAIFTVLPLVLFNTPLQHVVLRDIMGLDPELASYCEPAMALGFLMATFWSATALFRGLLAKARSTTSLAASGLLRILTAAAAASFGLAHPEINGAFFGVTAWILSYAIETAISTWQLRRLGWYAEG